MCVVHCWSVAEIPRARGCVRATRWRFLARPPFPLPLSPLRSPGRDVWIHTRGKETTRRSLEGGYKPSRSRAGRVVRTGVYARERNTRTARGGPPPSPRAAIVPRVKLDCQRVSRGGTRRRKGDWRYRTRTCLRERRNVDRSVRWTFLLPSFSEMIRTTERDFNFADHAVHVPRCTSSVCTSLLFRSSILKSRRDSRFFGSASSVLEADLYLPRFASGTGIESRNRKSEVYYHTTDLTMFLSLLMVFGLAVLASWLKSLSARSRGYHVAQL